jgi:hypothetical protein
MATPFDVEIRAKALDAALVFWSKGDCLDDTFVWFAVDVFEKYLRTGEHVRKGEMT